jgi:hypothetical protein
MVILRFKTDFAFSDFELAVTGKEDERFIASGRFKAQIMMRSVPPALAGGLKRPL